MNLLSKVRPADGIDTSPIVDKVAAGSDMQTEGTTASLGERTPSKDDPLQVDRDTSHWARYAAIYNSSTVLCFSKTCCGFISSLLFS